MRSDEVVGAVLCAGHGTRLRPATAVTPKPAVPFLGRPLAWYAVEALRRAGITRVGVNRHHLPEAMRGGLEAHAPAGVALTWSDEPRLLGTAGGARALWEALGRERPLVVYHGDVLFGAPLEGLLAAHRASGRRVTLALRLRDPDEALRNVFVDETGEVAGLFAHRRPGAVGRLREVAFTGVHVLSPEVFEALPTTGPGCLVTEVYPRLLEAGERLGAWLTTAFHADMGTYARYLDAQRAVFAAPARLPTAAWPSARAAGVHLGPGVEVEAGATLVAPVRLEGAIRVRAGARVGPNASLSGTIDVRADAALEEMAAWGRGALAGRVAGELRALGDA